MQPSQKERATGAVRCKKEGMLLQTLGWRCVECAIHQERNVRKEQHPFPRIHKTVNNYGTRLLITTVAALPRLHPVGINLFLFSSNAELI